MDISPYIYRYSPVDTGLCAGELFSIRVCTRTRRSVFLLRAIGDQLGSWLYTCVASPTKEKKKSRIWYQIDIGKQLCLRFFLAVSVILPQLQLWRWSRSLPRCCEILFLMQSPRCGKAAAVFVPSYIMYTMGRDLVAEVWKCCSMQMNLLLLVL